jgi:hypothetical protein
MHVAVPYHPKHHPMLRTNRHTGTNFYDGQRIQVNREEGYQLVWKIRASHYYPCWHKNQVRSS